MAKLNPNFPGHSRLPLSTLIQNTWGTGNVLPYWFTRGAPTPIRNTCEDMEDTSLRNPRPEIGPQCQVKFKMRYSLQTWPRRAARAGGPPRVPGGPAGGPRPRVRPQPPAASPPQVVWEWSDAEKSPRDALRPSETTTIWSRGPKSGDFPHVLQVHPQNGMTERVSG